MTTWTLLKDMGNLVICFLIIAGTLFLGLTVMQSQYIDLEQYCNETFNDSYNYIQEPCHLGLCLKCVYNETNKF